MKEIERKYLVQEKKIDFSQCERKFKIAQAYLLNTVEKTVRVRLKDDQAFLTIKGKTSSLTREEFEYQVPLADAEKMIDEFCDEVICKTRYEFNVSDKIWEVDVFEGSLQGLILAEIELESEKETFVAPPWLGREVSHDPSFYNAVLIKSNFSELPLKK